MAERERNVSGGPQVGKMSLFNAWYTKSTAIEEFEIAQNQTLDQAGNGLRDNWVTAVQLAFKSSFKDVGKGCWSNPASKCILSTVRQQCKLAPINNLQSALSVHCKCRSFVFALHSCGSRCSGTCSLSACIAAYGGTVLLI